VRMKRNDTHVPVSTFSAFRLPTAHKRFTHGGRLECNNERNSQAGTAAE